jgi:hypothetical protein
MSLQVQIGGLQMFSKHQKQTCKEKNVRREGNITNDILSQIF